MDEAFREQMRAKLLESRAEWTRRLEARPAAAICIECAKQEAAG